MANSEATVKVKLSYVQVLGTLKELPEMTLACPYTSLSAGTLDVPDATTSSTSYSVSFGSVADATLIVLSNNLAQDLTCRINGTDLDYKIPGGEKMVFAATALGATAISSVTLLTTDTQDGDGTVDYLIFGDPV